MNEKQIHRFVQRYLDATGCHIIEKSPAHFTVKLSPEADRALTNRPYYWSFVDRTGAEPETMTFRFITDKSKYETNANAAPADHAGRSGMDAAADAAMARSLGFVHGSPAAPARVPEEVLHFGSQRLEQIFGAARAGGRFVCLFQEPERRSRHPLESTPYTAWLGVNMKVEFASDRKREEIHSFGVSLATGQFVERFHERLVNLRMTPRLPPNIHLAKNGLTLGKALAAIEGSLEKKLRGYDYEWAKEASQRLKEELAQVAHYYEPLIAGAEEESKAAIAEQYERRKEEIRWQYEPRVTASVINCGIFHLEGIG